MIKLYTTTLGCVQLKQVSSSIYSTSGYKKQLRSANFNLCLCKVDKINHIFKHNFQKNFKKQRQNTKGGGTV